MEGRHLQPQDQRHRRGDRRQVGAGTQAAHRGGREEGEERQVGDEALPAHRGELAVHEPPGEEAHGRGCQKVNGPDPGFSATTFFRIKCSHPSKPQGSAL